ncbi:isopentenyl-diphosphate Delta-isomerase [Patescibacteria group bacterium]
MNIDKVVLVDEFDNQLGLEVKLTAHLGKGKLHRAVSVLVWRPLGEGIELLIQKRSVNKSLWPGVWANTICTHPRDDESYKDCAVRRLDEEMGIKITGNQLEKVFQFKYQASFNDELSEHELDTVFLCNWDGRPNINQTEIADFLWIDMDALAKEMKEEPESYTPWFHMIMKDERFINNIKTLNSKL